MTLGSHQRTIGKSQSHFTPRWILDALGRFDLDPCAGFPRPWDCATVNLSVGGLDVPWRGRVWLNPPFDRYEVGKWVQRLSDHGNGIALIHARTEAAWFEPIWNTATAILFLADRIKFCHADGSEQAANSGAPAVLCAFGQTNETILRASHIDGWVVSRRERHNQPGRREVSGKKREPWKPGEYCDRCNNTGEVDCRCGGDLCVCGRQELECPRCHGRAGRDEYPFDDEDEIEVK